MRLGMLDTDRDVLVIAEIGNNHEGKRAVAEELVRQAHRAGAQAVKFQTFKTEYFANPRDKVRYDRLASFELSQNDFRALRDLAKSLNLIFISTPLDIPSADFLAPIVDGFKVASGDNNFYPLLERVCESIKPVILSTGVSDESVVKKSVEFMRRCWKQQRAQGDLAILHCVSSYPAPAEEANLAVISSLRDMFQTTAGYSDHIPGIEASVLAVAAGADIIEKHFTLDHHFSEFRDHQLSADPSELAQLVSRVKAARAMRGAAQKKIQASESANAVAIRRSIVAGVNLSQGHRLTRNDILWMRPAGGLPPGDEDRVVGRVLRRDLTVGEPILLEDVES